MKGLMETSWGKKIADSDAAKWFASKFGRKADDIVTSSGAKLIPDPEKTTTVLGTYRNDTERLLKELNISQQKGMNPKSLDFGPNKGGFNMLNTETALYDQLGPVQFFNQVNKPFLDAAIKRGDNIIMATPLNAPHALKNRDGYITGYGREVNYLLRNGYYYDGATNTMRKRGR
jgi:hypothetical protein